MLFCINNFKRGNLAFSHTQWIYFMDSIYVFHNKPDLIKLTYSYRSIFGKIPGHRLHPAEKYRGFLYKNDIVEKI